MTIDCARFHFRRYCILGKCNGKDYALKEQYPPDYRHQDAQWLHIFHLNVYKRVLMITGKPYSFHKVNVPKTRTINPMALIYLYFTEYSRMVSRMNHIKYNILKESETCKSTVPEYTIW